MNTLSRQRILPKVLIFYMLFALLWWAILLFKKNKQETELSLKNLQLETNLLYNVNNYDIKSLAAYEKIITKHKRQQYMIIGEGLVFAFTLIIGMSLINRAYQKEVESKNQQSNFLLSVTHELRSPLASISLILETLKKRILSSEKVKELSGGALEESKRLEKQINNILLAAKLDKTYLFNFRLEDLSLLLEKTVEKYQRKYPELDIKFTSQDQEMTANVDLEAFHSMINNLVENAIKYSNGKPSIHILLTGDKNRNQISVKDQGLGISDEEKLKVKNQFYRVGSENTRRTKGTGLGLYIVDRLAKAHHGSLEISDNHPQGSIFTIKLPKAE